MLSKKENKMDTLVLIAVVVVVVSAIMLIVVLVLKAIGAFNWKG